MNTNTPAFGTPVLRCGAGQGKRGLWTMGLCLVLLSGCGGGGDDATAEDARVDAPLAGEVAEQQVATELAGKAALEPAAVKAAPMDVAAMEELLKAAATGEMAHTEAAAQPAAADAAEAIGAVDAKARRIDVSAQKHGRGFSPVPRSMNPVYRWNELALDAVRAGQLSDTQAARLYAMVNVAMYDAINGIETRNGGKRAQALVPAGGAPHGASLTAAASAAALAVLSRAAVPQTLKDRFAAQHRFDLDGLRRCEATEVGAQWGRKVGEQVVARRLNDGSSPTQGQAAGTGPGRFRAEWSGTQFRHLAPFAIEDASRYVQPGPPALNSKAYAEAFNQVRMLGSTSNPNAAHLETFNFWASNKGTSQPAGEWIKVALLIQRKKPLPLTESARLMALLGMALSDAVAPTITTKFNFHHWRPVDAIREGELDGNAKTGAVVTWSPRAGTPGGSPEYISGHSSFAGAGTTILRGFFCEDDISFTLLSDGAADLGSPARHYRSFSQVEAEAGFSRILGGVHFQFSNTDGLALGRGVAQEILATALLRTRGETHHRGCPK